MIRYLLALPLLLVWACAAAAQDNPIVQRMAPFIAAYNAGDAAAIGQFYAPDAALLPPLSRALVGREAIVAHYAQAFSQGVGNLRYEIIEIRQHGPNAAVEIGETVVDVGSQTLQGRSMRVWTLANGQWWLSRDMYHVLGTQ